MPMTSLYMPLIISWKREEIKNIFRFDFDLVTL